MGGYTGNTFNSHRLIAWAGQQHGQTAQHALVEHLFNAYFCQEKYIDDPSVLVDAAVAAGLPKTQAQDVVDDPKAYADEVQRDMRTYNAGITGVPHFIINQSVHLSGAQPVDLLQAVMEEAAGKGGVDGAGKENGGTC